MSQSSDTKQEIIKSAVRVFAKKGFWQAKISDIVADAGLSQGTFYNYFSSKEVCFGKIVQDIHDDVMNQAQNLIINNPSASLNDVCKIIIERFIEIRDVAKIFLFETLGSNEYFQEMVFSFKQDVRKLLKEVIIAKSNDEEKYDHLDTRVSLIAALIKEILEIDIIINMCTKEEIHSRIDEAIYIIFGSNL